MMALFNLQTKQQSKKLTDFKRTTSYFCYYCRTNYLWHSDVALRTTLLPHVSTMIVDVVSSVATEISM